MGNPISKSHRSQQIHTKQSKKRRISSQELPSKRQHENRHNISLDLDITDPAMIEAPVISWNCHHTLENIKKSIICVESNIDKIKCKQSYNLSTELNCITNCISQTIEGITHNYLDGLPNERILVDYWTNKIQTSIDNDDGIGVIVFEIAAMDKIHEKLGWKSGDNIIIATGKKIKEYCEWYSNDYCVKFKLFHPDFALNEFIILTTCTDEAVIDDLCDCVLTDVARSVKCFFQETTLWCGYVTNSKYSTKEIKDIRYNFRSYYEKAKCALKDAMQLTKFPTKHSDRIRKWISPQEKLQKGRNVLDIIQSYYTTNHHRYRNHNQSQSDIEIMDINEVISQIDKQIKNGADLNYYDNVRNTPMFYAISTKEQKLIQYLLQYDIDLDHKNNLGRTVLIESMRNNISETVCCILAQRTKYPNVPDTSNITPFVWALNCGYFKVMNILNKKGCMDYKNWIISCCLEDHEIILADIMRNNGIVFTSKLDNIGRSVLHYAVLHKAYNIIDMCLKNRHIHPDIVDNNGWSPLHYSAAKNYIKCIKLLIKYDSSIFSKTNEGLLAIDIAKEFRKRDSELLLKKYEIEAKDKLKKFQLSISNQSELSFDNTETIKIIEGSNDSNSDDEYALYEKDNDDWNKENEDINIQSRNRGISNSKSDVTSQSQPSSNSENIYEPTNNIYTKNKPFIKPNVSVINESDSDESESNQTRIIHNSFSDEIEQALIKNNEYEYEYEKDEATYNEMGKISINSISNEWNKYCSNENVSIKGK